MQQEKMAENTAHVVQQEHAIPATNPKQPAIEEIGGLKGPEPTRYGDWEKNGRCVDF